MTEIDKRKLTLAWAIVLIPLSVCFWLMWYLQSFWPIALYGFVALAIVVGGGERA